MWLLLMDDNMNILAKERVLCGDWSQWKINLNDKDKKFKAVIPEGK